MTIQQNVLVALRRDRDMKHLQSLNVQTVVNLGTTGNRLSESNLLGLRSLKCCFKQKHNDKCWHILKGFDYT